MEFQTEQEVEGLLGFIQSSPTSFHAVESAGKILEKAGFSRRKEAAGFGLAAVDDGGFASKEVMEQNRFYIIRNDSSLIAVQMPQKMPKGFRIMASHSDSPCFKLKAKPEITVDGQYVKLNVEKYGGMIVSTWLDRPLGIAGRVVIKEDGKLVSRLVDLEKDCCIIPNLAIHFNREINKGFEYNPQVDMLPLFSDEKDANVMQNIADLLGVQTTEILGSDLYLYVRDKGCKAGMKGEFLMAPRLDDLQCAYGTLRGFVEAKSEEYISVYCLFDNEEVGSRTRQGADSDFLFHMLSNIWKQAERKYSVSDSVNKTKTQTEIAEKKKDMDAKWNSDSGKVFPSFITAIDNSFLISADNAHALHPNHPEKSDLTNKPYLNKGIVLKFNGNAHYTTDGYSQAFIKDLCNQCGIEMQTFANRSDIPGGSTLGNILMSHVSIPAADIGLPQLSMHSAMETAGTKDVVDLIVLSKFYFGL